MKTLLGIVVVGALAAMGMAVYRLNHNGPSNGATLMVYCAANFKKPMEKVAEEYEKETGIPVHAQFGGTGTLMGQIQIARQGDLFIPADEGSLNDAKGKGLAGETTPLVVQHPVVAVKKGNPKGIHSIDDLLRRDVKLSLPDPDAASIGRVTRQLLGARWQGVADHAAVMKPTVTDAAADVKIGSVDAAFVWDSTTPQVEGLEAVELPELATHRENIAVAMLTFCKQKEAARKFAQYLAAPDHGGAIFRQNGFHLASESK